MCVGCMKRNVQRRPDDRLVLPSFLILSLSLSLSNHSQPLPSLSPSSHSIRPLTKPTMQLKSLFMALALLLLPAFTTATLYAHVDKLVTCQYSTITWARGPKTGELGVEVGHVVGKGPEYPITKPYKIGSGVSGSHKFYVDPKTYVANTKYFFGVTDLANANIHATTPNIKATNGCKK